MFAFIFLVLLNRIFIFLVCEWGRKFKRVEGIYYRGAELLEWRFLLLSMVSVFLVLLSDFILDLLGLWRFFEYVRGGEVLFGGGVFVFDFCVRSSSILR